MDNTDAATRSAVMSRIRSRDTAPELAVRRAIHSAGLRYRLHRKGLPGRPDLIFPGRRLALFVHGCFWHQHGCRLSHAPASRLDYWGPKLRRNKERDAENADSLTAAGWTVMCVWECETRSADVLAELVNSILAAPAAVPPKRDAARAAVSGKPIRQVRRGGP